MFYRKLLSTWASVLCLPFFDSVFTIHIMAHSRSSSPTTPTRVHDEPLLTTPTPPHVQAPNPTNRERFRIPRKPVGGHVYSSVTSRNSDEQDEGSTDSIASNNQNLLVWRPFYLRKHVLISFAIIFISLLVAVETLYQLSQHRHRLVSAEQRLKYLWTYGPTAGMRFWMTKP